MKEKPILFSGPMVRAILEGRKTQTRRVIKGIPDGFEGPYQNGKGVWVVTENNPPDVLREYPVKLPYEVGMRLWVRETWMPVAGCHGGYFAHYRADDEAMHITNGWRPSIFMPRWASRINLVVTSVRIERLQDLTEEDAIAEGSQEPSLVPIIGACWSERDVFAKLWQHINGKRGYGWDQNPWVSVIGFEREVKG